MTRQAGLGYTPVELLFFIFEDLTLTELDALEQAYARHQISYIINDYFHHRVVSSRQSPLLELVQIKRVREIEHLVSQSTLDVNISGSLGQTPLHIAATGGCVPVVQALLRFPGILVDRRDWDGRSSLVFAAQNNHLEVVRILLRHGATVDSQTHRGETALLWAARNGHEDIVDVLISENADPLCTDAEGWSGLDWAIMQGRVSVVELLLRHQNHFEGSDAQKNRVLLIAGESGNDQVIRMMLAVGADVNCKDDQENTPLHWAVSFGHHSAVELLLAWGADPNSRDMYGNTPLHWASIYPGVMQLLMSQDARVDSQNSKGRTSLMCSVWAEQEETTLLLLSLGRANVNIKDENDCTALHGAAANGNESIVLHLLNNGADAMVRDVDGWTALDFADVNGHVAVAAMLERKMPTECEQRLPSSSLFQHEDTRSFLKEIAYRKAMSSDGVTGLRSAVNRKHSHRLLGMLETCADVDEQDPLGGATALTLASWLDEQGMVRLLLDSGAAIDAKDDTGRTALHIAIEGGYYDLVALLVDKGANIEVKFCGWTPLLLAATRLWNPNVGAWMVEYLFLKSSEANLLAKDYYGRGVLHWCAVYGSEQTLAKLVGLASHLLDVGDHCWQSALHFSIGAYRPDLVQVLLQQDVNLASKSCDGVTPAHIVAYTGQLNVLTLLVERCMCMQERRGTIPIRPPGAELQLGAKDVDGYSALTIALLTGNLHVAQFLRRLPGGDDGSLQYRKGVAYTDVVTRQPPPLQLPTENEVIDVRRAEHGLCPQKPLFCRAVRKWLHDQRDLVCSAP